MKTFKEIQTEVRRLSFANSKGNPRRKLGLDYLSIWLRRNAYKVVDESSLKTVDEYTRSIRKLEKKIDLIQNGNGLSMQKSERIEELKEQSRVLAQRAENEKLTPVELKAIEKSLIKNLELMEGIIRTVVSLGTTVNVWYGDKTSAERQRYSA